MIIASKTFKEESQSMIHLISDAEYSLFTINSLCSRHFPPCYFCTVTLLITYGTNRTFWFTPPYFTFTEMFVSGGISLNFSAT